ncbi:hypothetical protein KBC54_01650 [Patescibacteria group bacterium]|nr:hypothetical protein [Patescibacteria group bacterium]
MTTTKSIKRATDGQKNQIAAILGALVKDLVGEADVDREGAQKLIGDAGTFKATLREPLMAAIRAHGTTNRFASEEEVASTFTYPAEYTGAKPLGVQASILRQDFPGLVLVNEDLATKPLITGAEGKFVIPLWQKVAPTYGQAVELVISKIKDKRTVYNFRDGQLGPNHLRQSTRSTEMWDKLAKQQEGHDLLVVDAQFGLRHRGRSIRRAREIFASNEFGFGAFAGLIMHLTHPEREVRWEQLHSDFAGDEYAPGADGVFSRAPICSFDGGEFRFYADDVDDPGGDFGAVSGFLPE